MSGECKHSLCGRLETGVSVDTFAKKDLVAQAVSQSCPVASVYQEAICTELEQQIKDIDLLQYVNCAANFNVPKQNCFSPSQ